MVFEVPALGCDAGEWVLHCSCFAAGLWVCVQNGGRGGHSWRFSDAGDWDLPFTCDAMAGDLTAGLWVCVQNVWRGGHSLRFSDAGD